VKHAVIERHQFYAAAKKCFAVVQNSENRPYGCFILKKGVVYDV
jgi:L-fucose mutarotase